MCSNFDRKFTDCYYRPGVEGSGKWSALHESAYKGDIADLDRLIKDGLDVNLTDDFGQTPLWVSAHEGKLEVTKKLL